MKEVFYENNWTHCRVFNSVFFTSHTTLHIIWGSTTSTSGFLLHWWRYFLKPRFIQVKCSENHPPSGCLQLDVQKCPVALEARDDFQPLSPTLGTHTCPCQWNWWKFCLKKVCSTGLAPICFPSCITKFLFTFFFHFSQPGQLNPWVIFCFYFKSLSFPGSLTCPEFYNA